MSISVEQLEDLVTGTLADREPPKLTQIAQELQDHVAYRHIIKDGKTIKAGDRIKRSVQVDKADSSRNVGLYEEDSYAQGRYTREIEYPWAHRTQNWMIDQREVSMNRGRQQIFDLMKVNEAACMIDMVEKHEREFWTKPLDSTVKNVCYGIEYFIVSDSTSAGDFVGGAPSGFSAGVGGLVHDRWRNWAAGYSAITKEDLIAKMRKAHRQCGFRSPIDIKDFRDGRGRRYKIYTNGTVYDRLTELGQAQNDNLGPDLAEMDGQITFKKVPFYWAPELDSKTDDPIYMIDCTSIETVFLGDFKFRRTKPKIHPKVHTAIVVHIDSTYQNICTNRRKNAVLTNSAA